MISSIIKLSKIGRMQDGKVDLKYDDNHLQSKNWESLYNGWLSPMDTDIEKAKETIDNYFKLEGVSMGLIKRKPFNLDKVSC